MKLKFLFISAIAIVGIAVYTLTLSFTNTAPLLSQLEALASGEDGESGGGTGGGDENPESGGQIKYMMTHPTYHCQEYRWVQVPDGAGGYNWERIAIGTGPSTVIASECKSGIGSDYGLSSCTPYDPCNPAKPA